jgi:uncharacterized membrane protein (DUF485 family)
MQDKETHSGKKLVQIINTLKWYPAITMFAWFFPSILVITHTFQYECNWLITLSHLTPTSQGFLISVVYFKSSNVYSLWCKQNVIEEENTPFIARRNVSSRSVASQGIPSSLSSVGGEENASRYTRTDTQNSVPRIGDSSDSSVQLSSAIYAYSFDEYTLEE